MLARFLNEANAKQRHYFTALLNRLRELSQRVQKMRCLPHRPDVGPSYDLYLVDSDREAARLLKQINRLLAPRIFRRIVEPTIWAEAGQAPAMRVAARSIRGSRLPRRKGESTTDEQGALDMLLGLAELGGLDRVRECPQCEEWFMAGRANQDYCRAECSRENYYERNKTKWPNYMRESRERTKMANQRKDLEQERSDLQRKHDAPSRSRAIVLNKQIAGIDKWFKEEGWKRNDKN